MLADDILDLLAHERFVSLHSVKGGWTITFSIRGECKTMFDGTLDTLLDRFAVVVSC